MAVGRECSDAEPAPTHGRICEIATRNKMFLRGVMGRSGQPLLVVRCMRLATVASPRGATPLLLRWRS